MPVIKLHIHRSSQTALAICSVCDAVSTCIHVDDDLRGYACTRCKERLKTAETKLLKAGIRQPEPLEIVAMEAAKL